MVSSLASSSCSLASWEAPRDAWVARGEPFRQGSLLVHGEPPDDKACGLRRQHSEVSILTECFDLCFVNGRDEQGPAALGAGGNGDDAPDEECDQARDPPEGRPGSSR